MSTAAATMDQKPPAIDPPSNAKDVDTTKEAKYQRNRVLGNARNKRWMKKKMETEAALLAEANQKRAELNLPAVTLKIEHKCNFKGGRRPNYNPPPEELAKMTPEDLSKWRFNERKRRKAEMQRINRLKKKQMLKDIKDEIPVLKSKVEEKNQTKQVAACLLQLQSGQALKGDAVPKVVTVDSDVKGNLKSEIGGELESSMVEVQGPHVRGGGDFGLKQDSPSLESSQGLISTVSSEEWDETVGTEPKINPADKRVVPNFSSLVLLATSAEVLHGTPSTSTTPKIGPLMETEKKKQALKNLYAVSRRNSNKAADVPPEIRKFPSTQVHNQALMPGGKLFAQEKLPPKASPTSVAIKNLHASQFPTELSIHPVQQNTNNLPTPEIPKLFDHTQNITNFCRNIAINMGLAPNMVPPESVKDPRDVYISLVRQHQLNHEFLLQMGRQNQCVAAGKRTYTELYATGNQSVNTTAELGKSPNCPKPAAVQKEEVPKAKVSTELYGTGNQSVKPTSELGKLPNHPKPAVVQKEEVPNPSPEKTDPDTPQILHHNKKIKTKFGYLVPVFMCPGDLEDASKSN